VSIFVILKLLFESYLLLRLLMKSP